MQKKKITAFLLALAMVSAMALPVFAQEPNPQAETAASIAVVETATPETAATEEPKVDAEPAEDNVKEDAATYDAPPENGWYQEYPGGPWYWYENGVRQGTAVVTGASGWPPRNTVSRRISPAARQSTAAPQRRSAQARCFWRRRSAVRAANGYKRLSPRR